MNYYRNDGVLKLNLKVDKENHSFRELFGSAEHVSEEGDQISSRVYLEMNENSIAGSKDQESKNMEVVEFNEVI